MRFPKWTEDEITLVLDLYFQIKRGEKKYHKAVFQEMSDILRSLNIYPEFLTDPKFRNANGISRKIGNFSAIDPDYTGKGLYAGSMLDKVIFMKYFEDPEYLKKSVTDIKKRYLKAKAKNNKLLNWTEEELVLAFALYKELSYGQMHGGNPKVKRLSKLLNELPIHDTKLRPANFRSISSVSLRLSNYRSCDPNCNAKGLLSSGVGFFKEIFNKYSNDPKLLSETISDMEKKYNFNMNEILGKENDSSPETEVLTVDKESRFNRHKSKENNSVFYIRVKEHLYKESKCCEICGLDIYEKYGELGIDLMEYHCIKKFTSDNTYENTNIGDYIQVCPTCHKFLDKYYDSIDYQDLSLLVKKK